MNPAFPSDADPLDAVVESFLERYRRGERPSLTEYIEQYPELAGRIRETLRVDVPVAERGRPEHAGLLAEVHGKLWSLIRDEAATADREMQRV